MTNLYDDIGGAAALEAAISSLYGRIINDAEINGFFTGVDVVSQRGKMEKFLRLAFSGKAQNAEVYMREAHKRLAAKGLNDGHFDRVAGHLQAVLEELGVAPAHQAQIMAAVGSLRDAVLNRATVVDLATA